MVKKLQENPEFRPLSTEMICSDESDVNSPSAAWTNTINRDGIVKVTPGAYQLFLTIECYVRCHLNVKNSVVKNASKIDGDFKRYLTNILIHDNDVLFYFCCSL